MTAGQAYLPGWSVERRCALTTVMDWISALPPALMLIFGFLLPAVEASVMVGMFIPGETAVVIAGVAAHEGRLPIWAVAIVAVAGAIVGDQIGFTVGRRVGPALITRLPRRLRESGKIDEALAFVDRRGALAVVLGRWTALLRALVPGICGMSGMSRRSFSIGNAVGGLIWGVQAAAIGYLAGAGYHAVLDKVDNAGTIALAVIVVLGLAVLAASHVRALLGKG